MASSVVVLRDVNRRFVDVVVVAVVVVVVGRTKAGNRDDDEEEKRNRDVLSDGDNASTYIPMTRRIEYNASRILILP